MNLHGTTHISKYIMNAKPLTIVLHGYDVDNISW